MAYLPTALAHAVVQQLQQLGDYSTLIDCLPVSGGCINNGCQIRTAQAHYFLKWNAHAPPDMFATEARGLQLLAAAQCVRVPTVLAVSGGTDTSPPFLLLEWLAPEPHGHTDWARLGEQLAHLHRTCTAAQFGLDHDNYIGTTTQINTPHDDWVVFFRECRLRPQIALAQRNRLLSTTQQHQLERLLTRLPDWLGMMAHTPALLHGDLWRGNVLAGAGDIPVLLDPAVYYGEREAEIAYTELFGRFPEPFYRAYHATYPLDAGYALRRDLYNLYHLLNHLNLFGESYRSSISAVLAQVVS